MSSTDFLKDGLNRVYALKRIGELAVEMIQKEDALNEAFSKLDPTGQCFQDLQHQCNEARDKLYMEVWEFTHANNAAGGAPGHTGEVKE